MANTNISKVYLLNVPLELDYKHTLYFNSLSSQNSYFLSKKLKEYTDFSYQRKDNVIRIPDHYDNIYSANYVCYQNSKYNNKWFYAFIKDLRYISDGVTEVEIETDVIQTWLFDYQFKPSFIEREHTKDDTIGKNTVPENLETGEYIVNGKQVDSKTSKMAIVMAYSDYANIDANVTGKLYGGIYSGMAYSIYPMDEDGVSAINRDIHTYDDEGKADAINSIFMAPTFLFGDIGDDFGAMCLGGSNSPKEYEILVPKLKTVDGYTPKNKKLLTFPYTYLMAINNGGGSAIYKQERFTHPDNCTFLVEGVLTPGCSIKLSPSLYNGDAVNNSESLMLAKYPICCWNSDAYTNWQTQNSVNTIVSYGTAGLSIIAGAGLILSGAGAMVGGGLIAGGLGGVANATAQQYQHSLVPDQLKGVTNGGDVNAGAKENSFMFYKMSIKDEYAKIIDKYFDMFGYKVNMVKIPNEAHRGRYWYTKTIDANIDGMIPQKDLQKIKSVYNNGITFWRNANEIGNYDLDNYISIVA